MGEVLDRFGKRRLLTFDRNARGEPTVEVAHEALLTRWPRLAGWVDEQREDLWERSRLRSAADEWARSGRDVGFLLSTARLDRFESWAGTTNLRLSGTEVEFLQASVRERHRQQREAAGRIEHERSLERSAARRLKALVGVFAGATTVAAILLLIVLGQRQDARRQEDIASARELAAASMGALSADPELSLLLALQAAATTSDRGYVVEEAMDAVHWALQDSGVPYPYTESLVGVRSAPDGPRGVFLLAPDRLLQQAADAAGRELTAEECRTYLHREACPLDVAWVADRYEVYTDEGPTPVERLAGDSLQGSKVRVLTELGGELGPLAEAFSGLHGVEVEWMSVPAATGFDDGSDEWAADVLVTPRAGLVTSLARQGTLIELPEFFDAIATGIGVDPYLRGLAEGSDGQLDAVPWSVSVSSLVWYDADEFEAAGYRPPKTWDQLLALSEQMVADGRTPWCLGVDDNAVPGAVATDWIEDLVLHASGPRLYDEWIAHRTSFRDAAIQAAYRRFGEVAFGESFVLGGTASINHIEREIAAWPMFSDPPLCLLHRDGSESRLQWPQRDSPELAAFSFPTIDPEYGRAVVGRVYLITMIRDRPEVRRFVEFMLSSDAAVVMASTSATHGLVAVRSADPALNGGSFGLTDELFRTAIEAGLFRADASDLMPPLVGSGSFPEGLMTYLTWGEQSLRQVLIANENAWPR